MTRFTDAVPFVRGGWRGLAAPEMLPFVEEVVLTDPEALARQGEPLRESRYRVTARIRGPGGQDLLLKAHRFRKRGEALRGLVAATRARAEWDAARWLDERGLPVPRAWAFGERRRGARLEEAFLLTEYVAGARSLRRALDDATPEARLALASAAGELVRRMHEAGFDHRDLHGENVLVRAGDRPSLVLVDLHRHKRGVRVPRARRVAALGRLLHDLDASLDGDARRRLIAAWAGEGALPPDVRRLEEEAAQVGRRLERVRRRSRARRCLVESTVYTRDVGEARGARRRDLPVARIEAALVAHDEALAAGDARVVKRGPKSAVTRHGDLVVKEGFPAGTAGRVKDTVAPLRRRAGYRNAHLLGVLGVATARPLAWVRVRGRDLTLYEDLSRLPRLDHHAGAVYRSASRAAQIRLRDAVADWLASLHREGIYHGDLKGVNVLVRDEAGMLEFPVIDTDRVRFFDQPVGQRRIVKNLAQLSASIPRAVTRTERLRWYRRYASRVPGLAGERQIAREVEAAVARKIVVVDDPIE